MAVKQLSAVLVAAHYPKQCELRQKLAKRDGVLVINIHENDSEDYNLHMLVTERTVSNNITATGGNIELMTIEDVV